MRPMLCSSEPTPRSPVDGRAVGFRFSSAEAPAPAVFGLTEAGSVNKLRCSMSRPVIEVESVVRPEWIDSNGHLNLAYYVVVFDLATDALYTALDIGEAYREASGNSCFTAETHTLYEREVHLGDKLQ